MTKYIESLISSPIVLLFLIIMVFLFLCDLITFYIKWSKHLDFKSTIVSLGVLGTFVGISIGLWEFDTTSIEGSVPKFLGGLKVAFHTSVMGLFFSIVLIIIERFFSVDSDANKSEKEQVMEMIKQIKLQRAELQIGFSKSHKTHANISDNVAKFNDQISGLHTELRDQSGQSRELIKGEFSKANQTLKESLQKISEGANKEIIATLNESIHGFNDALTEQFGENFKRLNDACLKLVEWQEAHKQEVEATHKQLEASLAALTQTEATLATVADRNQEVLKTYDSLRDTIATYDNQTNALTAHLEKYGALADKAEKMFADADSRFAKVTDTMSSFADDVKQLAVVQHEALKELTGQMSTQNEEIVGGIRQSIDNMQKSINGQSQELGKLAEEFVSSINEMEGIFVSITEKMGKKYEDFMSGAEHIASMSQRDVRDNR